MHSTVLTCVEVCIKRHWLVLLFNGLSGLDGRASDSGRGGLGLKGRRIESRDGLLEVLAFSSGLD